MQAAASGAPIQLRDATLGGYVPGGAAYGAERNGRQVLVQRGAAGTGANLAGSVNFAGQTLDPLTVGQDVMWIPRGGQPTEVERRYGIGARTTEPPSEVDPPAQDPSVLSDDADVRASEARRMLQQATPFWEREENKALKIAAGPVSEGGGPRAGEVGYAQRADIQAWMDAQRAKGPAGAAMVERFMNQQRERGLLEQPTPAVDRLIATPEQREAAMTGYDGRQPQQLQAQGGGSIRGGEMLPNQAFVDPAFGIEALRGMPVDATASSMPGVGQRGQASVGYDGEVIRDAFNQATPQPNMTFTGNGMESDTQMMVSREQDVPGITGPVLSPTATRQMNLQGADALANKYKLLAMQR